MIFNIKEKKNKYSALLALFVIAFFSPVLSKESVKMVSLIFSLNENKAQLTGAKSYLGKIRATENPSSNTQEILEYIVTDSSGKVIHKGQLPDPFLVRAERLSDQGACTSIRLDSVDIQIRTPFYVNQDEVTLYHVILSPGLFKKRIQKTILGRFKLNI